MIQQLQDFIEKEQLFLSHDKILLAVSGGMDSMLMAYLFHQSGYEIGIAHCNFQLRGKASDEDEALVVAIAKEWNVPYFTTRFDTLSLAKKEKRSIQMLARDLRYEWLESTRKKHGFQYIATAHHLNDSIETVLYNLTKGTGIRGLHGIPVKNGSIIRPLLFASREDILKFVKENDIPYREDASNISTKYHRNLIRHEVIPVLKKINPSLEGTFHQTIDNLSETELVFNEYINAVKKKIIKKYNGAWGISKQKLSKYPAKKTILYEILAPFHFNRFQVEQIFKSFDSIGSRFYSKDHELLIDRFYLIYHPQFDQVIVNLTIWEIPLQPVSVPSGWIYFDWISSIPKTLKVPKNTALLDMDQLESPLTLRTWKPGDRFQPYGMKGKSKKIQDYLTDEKLDRIEKEKTLVLCNKDTIYWVVGHRIDDRVKVTQTTNQVLRVRFEKLSA